MTTPIKTQCPHCQAYSKVQQTQLNTVNATVSCDQCHQSFLVNKHLVVSHDVASTSPTKVKIAPTASNNKQAINKQAVQAPKNHQQSKNLSNDDGASVTKQQASKSSIPDGLIHDDMDMDIDDSLDGMDAWLTKVSHSEPIAAVTDKPKPAISKHTNQNSSVAVPSSLPKTSTASSPPLKKSISSSEANSIHANVDSTSDHSWLEKLLEEQSKREEMPADDTDLSQILLDMGVPIRTDESSLEERLKKSQSHFASTPTTHSIASILWLLGCLVLALLLAAQYVMFNLDTLIKNPNHAQRLQAICSIAACRLPSADLSALTVSNTTHRSSQIKTTGAFSDIGATLNNQSAQAQLYPNVKVSVYGDNALIGMFIAAPSDYLLGKQSQLPAADQRRLLFTIPIANTQIRQVTMTPIY